MDDIISRQTAIDAIQQHREGVLGGYEYDEGVAFVYAAAHNHIIDVIKRLPSAQTEQRWIPVTERLPEDHEPKLLTHEVHYLTGKVIKDVRMAYYDDENDNWLSDEESPEILCYPLAWMPLPEPWDGEKR